MFQTPRIIFKTETIYVTDFKYSRSKFYKTIFSVIFSSSILESVNSMEVVKGAITAVFTYATTGQNHSVPQASQDLVQKYHNLINERDVKRLQTFCNKEIKQHYSQYELATHKDEKKKIYGKNH